MHVDMFEMVRTVKLNAPRLHLLMLVKRVNSVVATASEVALVQVTVLARAAAMPARLWFMNQTIHIASAHRAENVHRISMEGLHEATGHATQ